MREHRRRHPRFREAVQADAVITAARRGDRHDFRSGTDAALQAIRLAWVSDAFAAQVLYRAKARLQALGIPVLPRIAHRLSMLLAQVSIGDPVIVQPGLYILHGQVVIDGFVEIGPGVAIGPWVTIGLRPGDFTGPTIREDVTIGTGAKLLGRLEVGAGAKVAANAVVLADVQPGDTVAGAPASSVARS
jgi:serine O-acetyltransferase